MALKDITLGQYFPGHSLIHRFDPRGKIIFTVIYIVAIFLCNSLLSYGVALAVLLILIFTVSYWVGRRIAKAP